MCLRIVVRLHSGRRVSGCVLHRIEPPAGDRGAGGGFVRSGAQHQGGDAGFLGGKLQAPAGGKRHVRYFADDSSDPSAAQAFFHCPQRVCVTPGAHQNHARWVDAELQQSGAV